MRAYLNTWLAKGAMTTLIVMATVGATWATDFRPLIGRWQRTDGGYVIDIKRVTPEGKVEAAYFNPRPINVSRAEADVLKGHIKVEVELRDTGYPGSSYTLLYDPDRDALMGIYYQAVQKQNFDVIFFRMN